MEEHKETNGNEKVGSCMCETMPKDTEWDDERWKKHWADQREGHQKRLERLHQEANKYRRTNWNGTNR